MIASALPKEMKLLTYFFYSITLLSIISLLEVGLDWSSLQYGNIGFSTIPATSKKQVEVMFPKIYSLRDFSKESLLSIDDGLFPLEHEYIASIGALPRLRDISLLFPYMRAIQKSIEDEDDLILIVKDGFCPLYTDSEVWKEDIKASFSEANGPIVFFRANSDRSSKKMQLASGREEIAGFGVRKQFLRPMIEYLSEVLLVMKQKISPFDFELSLVQSLKAQGIDVPIMTKQLFKDIDA